MNAGSLQRLCQKQTLNSKLYLYTYRSPIKSSIRLAGESKVFMMLAFIFDF